MTCLRGSWTAVLLLAVFAPQAAARVEDHGLVLYWAADGIHEVFMNSTQDSARIILKHPRGDDEKALWPPAIGGMCADAAHGIVAWTENRHIGGKNKRGVFMAELDGSSTEPTLIADLGDADGDLSQGCAIDPDKLTIYFCEFIFEIHKQRISEVKFKGYHGHWEIDGELYAGRTMAVQETHPQGGGVILKDGFPYMTASQVTSGNRDGVPGLYKELSDTYEPVTSTQHFGGWKGHLGFPILQVDGSILLTDSDASTIPSDKRTSAVYSVPDDMVSPLEFPFRRPTMPLSPHVGDDSVPGETNSIALQPTASTTSVANDILFLQGEPPQVIYERSVDAITGKVDQRVVYQAGPEELGTYGIGPVIWTEDHIPAPVTPAPPKPEKTPVPDTDAPPAATDAPKPDATSEPTAAPADATLMPDATTDEPAALMTTAKPSVPDTLEPGPPPTPNPQTTPADSKTPSPDLSAGAGAKSDSGSDDGVSVLVVVLIAVGASLLCLLVGTCVGYRMLGKRRQTGRDNERRLMFDEQTTVRSHEVAPDTSSLPSLKTHSPPGTPQNGPSGSPSPFSPLVERNMSTWTTGTMCTDASLVQTTDLSHTTLRAPAGDVRIASHIEIMEHSPLDEVGARGSGSSGRGKGASPLSTSGSSTASPRASLSRGSRRRVHTAAHAYQAHDKPFGPASNRLY
eukprot:Rhum_TRINITY_DN15478_c8_g1::Rhum_TRINITY_DN15478_c8_g1_i1::g.160650::m.160650